METRVKQSAQEFKGALLEEEARSDREEASHAMSHKARRKEKKNYHSDDHISAQMQKIVIELAELTHLPSDLVLLVVRDYQIVLMKEQPSLPKMDAFGNTILPPGTVMSNSEAHKNAKLQRSPGASVQSQNKMKSKHIWLEKEREWHQLWDSLHLYVKGLDLIQGTHSSFVPSRHALFFAKARQCRQTAEKHCAK